MSKLELGRVVTTIGIVEEMEVKSSKLKEFIDSCLGRHELGDWGDLDEEDKKSNDHYLENNGRILSSYNVPDGMNVSEWKIWIITEWDRSVTTILFPSEY